MSATPPTEVLDRRRQLMMDGDAEWLADLFTPDAVMEFTFHGPPGARLISGTGAASITRR